MPFDISDPYFILSSFQRHPGVSSVSGNQDPESPRLMHLRSLGSGLGFNEIRFGNNNDRVNFWARLGPNDESKQTTILLAHHDVVKPGFDTLDNTASIAVVLATANRLLGLNLDRNLVVYFTDGEEVGGLGVRHVLAPQIESGVFGKKPEVINLELCACGDVMVLDGSSKSLKKIPEVLQIGLPLSDGVFLQLEGIENVGTVTLMPRDQLEGVLEHSTCDHWKKCHTEDDKFDLASASDMNNLVEVLVSALA